MIQTKPRCKPRFLFVLVMRSNQSATSCKARARIGTHTTGMRIPELIELPALSATAEGVGFNPTPVKGCPMRSTQQFSITLPNEMADAVRAKVATGEYATESEVIRDGLRALLARDRAMEAWLRDQVVPAAQALAADPSSAVPLEEARNRVASKRRARSGSDHE